MTPQKKLIRAAEIALAIILVFYYFSYKELKRQHHNTLSILNEKEAVIETVRLANGKLKQEKDIAVGDIKSIKEHYGAEVKDLKKNHDIDIKQLHSYYRSKMQTTGSGEVTIGDTIIVRNDSTVIKYPSIRIDDGYLSLAGYFTEAKFSYDYTVTDSLSIAYYWTQKGVWPFRTNDQLRVSFSSQNPNTHLSAVTSIVIDDKKKTRFSVGPFIGYGINSLGKSSIQVGVGVQLALFRF